MHEHFEKPVLTSTEVKPTIVENLGTEKLVTKETTFTQEKINPELHSNKLLLEKKGMAMTHEEKERLDEEYDEQGKKKGLGTKIKEMFTGHS